MYLTVLHVSYFLTEMYLQCIHFDSAFSLIKNSSFPVFIQQLCFTFSGVHSPLLSMAKTLFTHVHDILSNSPSFQSEYGTILRHLLEITDYRFQMRKRTYSSEFYKNLYLLIASSCHGSGACGGMLVLGIF